MSQPATEAPRSDEDVQRLTAEDVLVSLAGLALSLAAERNARILVGITGGPGAGKSTMANALVEMVNEMVPGAMALLPMDGFHRPHAELEAEKLADEKGAPHTFDVAAFVDHLKAVKGARQGVVGPTYSRETEDVVPNGATIGGNVPIVIVEGNYLLLERPGWSEVGDVLDICVHISVPRTVVEQRLRKRHTEHDKHDETFIDAHVDNVDLPNYDLVESCRSRADIIFDISDAA